MNVGPINAPIYNGAYDVPKMKIGYGFWLESHVPCQIREGPSKGNLL